MNKNVHGPCVRKSLFQGEMFRFCLAGAVVLESAVFPKRLQGTKLFLRTFEILARLVPFALLDPAERNAVEFF